MSNNANDSFSMPRGGGGGEDESSILRSDSSRWGGSQMSLTSTVSSAKWVVFDVAGKEFRAARTTLLREPSSLLAAMVDPQCDCEALYNESGGRIFVDTDNGGADRWNIDMDPKLFEFILKYLRTGKLLGNFPDGYTVAEIRAEAEFLLLPRLVELIAKRDQHTSGPSRPATPTSSSQVHPAHVVQPPPGLPNPAIPLVHQQQPKMAPPPGFSPHQPGAAAPLGPPGFPAKQFIAASSDSNNDDFEQYAPIKAPPPPLLSHPEMDFVEEAQCARISASDLSSMGPPVPPSPAALMAEQNIMDMDDQQLNNVFVAPPSAMAEERLLDIVEDWTDSHFDQQEGNGQQPFVEVEPIVQIDQCFLGMAVGCNGAMMDYHQQELQNNDDHFVDALPHLPTHPPSSTICYQLINGCVVNYEIAYQRKTTSADKFIRMLERQPVPNPCHFERFPKLGAIIFALQQLAIRYPNGCKIEQYMQFENECKMRRPTQDQFCFNNTMPTVVSLLQAGNLLTMDTANGKLCVSNEVLCTQLLCLRKNFASNLYRHLLNSKNHYLPLRKLLAEAHQFVPSGAKRVPGPESFVALCNRQPVIFQLRFPAATPAGKHILDNNYSLDNAFIGLNPALVSRNGEQQQQRRVGWRVVLDCDCWLAVGAESVQCDCAVCCSLPQLQGA